MNGFVSKKVGYSIINDFMKELGVDCPIKVSKEKVRGVKNAYDVTIHIFPSPDCFVDKIMNLSCFINGKTVDVLSGDVLINVIREGNTFRFCFGDTHLNKSLGRVVSRLVA